MTARLSAAHVRGKLRALGQRRHTLAQASAQLESETATALEEARGTVPIAEAAALAGVARSTAYVVMGRRGDGDVERSAAGGS